MAAYRRFVKLDDPHYPFQDKRAVAAAMTFVAQFKPKLIIIGGDWCDCKRLARFDKPLVGESLQEELDSAGAGLADLRSVAGDAEIVYIRGNHEARLVKFMRSRCAEMESLRDLTIPKQLRFGRLDIGYSETNIFRSGVIFGHGKIVRQKAGYTATSEMLKAWASGATGHTHRLGQVYYTAGNGQTYTWIEGGCLCRFDQEYLEGVIPNWQHGIVFGELGANPLITFAPINGGRVRAFI